MPLLAAGHPVDWWFAFKFNAASFPDAPGANAACPFGGNAVVLDIVEPAVRGRQRAKSLHAGSGRVGETDDDPVGATFEEIYTAPSYVVWNDQFYEDPKIAGCGELQLSAPWGHSKGLVAWDETAMAS